MVRCRVGVFSAVDDVSSGGSIIFQRTLIFEALIRACMVNAHTSVRATACTVVPTVNVGAPYLAWPDCDMLDS